MNDKGKHTYQWPENLLRAIFSEEEYSQWEQHKPKDASPLMEYMIDSSFQDFERDILCRRYQYGQSLQTIGEAHSVTREWIRLVLIKCVGRLQNYQRRETLIHGLEWKIEKEKERAYQEGFRKGYRESLGVSLDTVHRQYTMDDFLAGLPGYKCDLSELGLCEPTYNRLKRCGITSLEQLLQLSLEDLCSQFRVSKRAREEITVKLEGKGLRLRNNQYENCETILVQRVDGWILEVMTRVFHEEMEAFVKGIPGDFKESFLYLIHTELTESECKVLRGHFEDAQNMDAISRELSLTRQQVTGLLNSALQKLGSKKLKAWLRYGIRGEIKSQIRVASEQGYIDGFDTGIGRETKMPIGADGETGRKMLEQTLESISIEALQLSVRAKHCLYRAGITSIGDLMKHSDRQLLAIRNLGFGMLNEIREKQRMHYCEVRTDLEIARLKCTVSKSHDEALL